MNKLNKNYLMKLKNEHKIVERFLEDIKGFIQMNDVQGIASRMDLLKNALIEHLKKKDNKMYADLLTTAREKNIGMVYTAIDTFFTAMKGIADRVLKFFDKYPDKDAITRLTAEFSKDFQEAYADILMMVNNEERILYPLYEKHCC